MSQRTSIAVTALAFTWALAAPPTTRCSAADTAAKPAKEKPGDGVFGLTKVWQLHLELSAKDWEAMQPKRGAMRFPGFPGAPRPAEKPADKTKEAAADTHRSVFGMEFPWAHGTLTVDGKTFADVGVRYKGNASYMASANALKRSFKIQLEHYAEDLRFHGLKTLNLNSGAMDPTKAREALSFAVFRAAGVPAPRTAYVEVTLTVPGKYDKEYLGLYTMIEQVDKLFLKDRFANGKGLLMKPERLRGLEYLGDDWTRYTDRYQPKHEASKNDAARVIDLARLVNKADDEQFRKQIASFLDVDEFLRFLAGNALLANLDSFLGVGHNYYLYLNPETNKFVFIPWDMDLSLAGFPMGGSGEQQLDLSVSHPHLGANKLIDRLLAMPEVNAQYQKLLKELAASCFTKEKLLADVEAVERATKDLIAKDRKAAAARKEGTARFGPMPGMMGRSPDLHTFVAKRTESVTAQLAGKSKGYVPAGMGFGPGGRPGGPGGPGGFNIGNLLAKPLLTALDSDKDGKVSKEEWLAAVKKFFADCDTGKKGKIDEQALTDGLNRIFPPPPGFGPPGGAGAPPGPPPGGPGGAMPGGGPGGHAARTIMRRLGAEKDGTVTLAQLLTEAEKLFAECDKGKTGSLDEKAIATGIGLVMPPPRFGPPRGGPDAPKQEGKP